MKKRRTISFILVTALMLSMISPSMETQAASKYSKYSNKRYSWGLKQNKKHKSPSGPTSAKTLKKYDAYYKGAPAKGDKVIYLTFDCGVENGYTGKILDYLKKYNVKAAFFVTTPYIKKYRKLVKRMKKEGHLVGNHTTTHPDLSKCSVSKIKKELRNCEKAMKKYTGYELDKFVRPPMGCYSKRAMKVMKDMGYTTVFWSLAYGDYFSKNCMSKKQVLKKFKTYYHNGMLPLVHVMCKGNRDAIPSIVKYMRGIGYRFGTLSELKEKN